MQPILWYFIYMALRTAKETNGGLAFVCIFSAILFIIVAIILIVITIGKEKELQEIFD